MEVELHHPFCNEASSQGVPAHAWSEEIIYDYMEQNAVGLSQVIILNQKVCLLLKGKRSTNEGYSWEEGRRIGNQISGQATWVSKDVMLRAIPITLTKAKVDIAKVRQFIRNQNLEKIAMKRLKDFRKEKSGQTSTPVAETPELPCMKKTPHRADHATLSKTSRIGY